MSPENQWRWRALWALAAFLWLSVVPAMAMDAADMARDSAHKVDVLIASSAARLRTLAGPRPTLVSAHKKSGPAWPDRLLQTREA